MYHVWGGKTLIEWQRKVEGLKLGQVVNKDLVKIGVRASDSAG